MFGKDSKTGGRGHVGIVKRGAVLGAMLAALAGGAVTGGTTPANAAVGGCWSGLDAGTNDWAWGSCTGVTGSSHWRLHVSCTWGSTRYSSWFYGSGRTDVHCPFPERVRSTQVDIVY